MFRVLLGHHRIKLLLLLRCQQGANTRPGLLARFVETWTQLSTQRAILIARFVEDSPYGRGLLISQTQFAAHFLKAFVHRALTRFRALSAGPRSVQSSKCHTGNAPKYEHYTQHQPYFQSCATCDSHFEVLPPDVSTTIPNTSSRDSAFRLSIVCSTPGSRVSERASSSSPNNPAGALGWIDHIISIAENKAIRAIAGIARRATKSNVSQPPVSSRRSFSSAIAARNRMYRNGEDAAASTSLSLLAAASKTTRPARSSCSSICRFALNILFLQWRLPVQRLTQQRRP